MKKKCTLLFAIIILMANSLSAQIWGNACAGSGFNDQVLCLVADSANHILYAGGAFTSVDGTTANGIAKWNGISWTPVGAGFTQTGGSAVVYAIALFNNQLYAGGYFTTSGSNTVHNIAKWNGTDWVPVSTGMSVTGTYDFVNAFAVFNNELYVGGTFTTAGTINAKNIAKWNGTVWSTVAGGIYDRVNALHVYNNELYAGGNFVINNITFNLQYRISKMTTGGWVNVGSTGLGDATMAWSVKALTTYKNKMFAGGYFNVLESGTTVANHMASWNGTVWSTVGTPAGVTSTATDPIRALKVYNGKLYAAGIFTGAGSTAAVNLASWNDTTWSTVTSSGLDNKVNAMAVFDGSLVIAGAFTNAGGVPRGHIAKFTTTPVSVASTEKLLESILYPNPATDVATLTVHSTEQLHNATLLVHDITGKLVKEITGINSNTISIKRDALLGGTYTYSLYNNNSNVSKGKIIFE
jgi:hypothetical protein